MPAWPASLPQLPSDGGFAEQPHDNAARFQPEVGPDMTRRRGTATATDVSVTLPPMTKAQAATFVAFYMDDMKAGTQTFTWAHPRTGVSATFRFAGPYRLDHLTYNLWQVSFGLVELP